MKHSNFISALLFAGLLLVSGGNALAQGSAAGDRAALVALYDATDGANWEVIRNWKTTAPIEEWYGVVYAWAGRVFILHLHENRLSGAIPASLGNKLTELSLFSNRLSGAIPAELGNLTRLRYLSLYGNQLTGTIPAELGNLSRLERLSLYGNQLSGTIPASLGNLIDLDYLSLDTDTGLCLAHDFPLTSMFARLAQAHTPPIAVCNGDTPDGPTPEVFTLDFAHFANGDGITSDLVFVNVGTHPIRPALYFYDKEGHLIAAESVVDIMGDLEVAGDGSLTVQTEIEPLGELTISTHGGGEVVTGSVTVDANGPIGGVLRFDLPGIGVAGVGASSPLSDAIFPVRRQEAGINTGVAIHNLESSPEIVRCELMQGGTVLDDVSIPLAANGQSSWFIDAAFTAADTSGFVGSVRCDAVGTGMFTAVALELDAVNRIFTTLPVVPVPERTDRE